jgi:hypothetical protein
VGNRNISIVDKEYNSSQKEKGELTNTVMQTQE